MVCTGNACRSPMAAAILQRRLAERGVDARVTSAGTMPWSSGATGPAGPTGATGTTVWMDPQTSGFCVLLTTALREKAPWRLVHLSNAVAGAFV